MGNQYNVDSFREELSYYHECIMIVISHFSEMFDFDDVPFDIRYDLQTKAVQCSEILKKYGECLQSENELLFRQRMLKIIPTMEEEMVFVFNYLGDLNCHLFDYGDGPTFSENKILHTQPMDI